ncbi:MAG: hypothetical protein LRS43_00150 [Desulfurococcales archaeon]|nr:hypothetical protein [Desulfurococcales archaeon]
MDRGEGIVLTVEEVIQRIPHHILDAIMDLHAAIDPETGHLSCHHYTLGLAVASVKGRVVPLMVVGDCMYVAFGSSSRAIIDSVTGSAHVKGIEEGMAIVGESMVDSSLLSTAITLAREVRSRISFHNIRVRMNGREENLALISIEGKTEEETMAILIGRCREEAEGKEQLHV